MNRTGMNRTDGGDSPIDAQLAAPPASVPETPSGPNGGPVQRPAERDGDLLQSRGVVLAILFLVTGALGIPLLWINQKFSNAERIIWSVLVTIYTMALIAAVGWILWWAWTRIFP